MVYGLCNETSRSRRTTFIMADMDMLAAMGISGFGKATLKKHLDPSRFDKNKREEVEFQCLRHGFNPSNMLQRNLHR